MQDEKTYAMRIPAAAFLCGESPMTGPLVAAGPPAMSEVVEG